MTMAERNGGGRDRDDSGTETPLRGSRRFTKRSEVSDTDTSNRLAGVGGRDGRCFRDEVICAVRDIEGKKEKGGNGGVRELRDYITIDSNRDFRLRAERTCRARL